MGPQSAFAQANMSRQAKCKNSSPMGGTSRADVHARPARLGYNESRRVARSSGGNRMKVCVFEQLPYRYLPAGFNERYSSVVTTPYFDLVEPGRMQESLQSGYAELLHAARAGFDGV